jgi:hypothetical protein
MMTQEADLAALISLLDFIVERLDLARSSSGQAPSIAEARGVVPYLRSKLDQNTGLKAAILFNPTLGSYVYSPFAEENWNELANQAQPIFAKSADEVIASVQAVKDALNQRECSLIPP